jgi:hypothetical protein
MQVKRGPSARMALRGREWPVAHDRKPGSQRGHLRLSVVVGCSTLAKHRGSLPSLFALLGYLVAEGRNFQRAIANRTLTAETIVLIHIPRPLADNPVAEHGPNPDRNSEVTVVDPLSGIVIIIDQASAEKGGARHGAVKRRRYSPLWRSSLSRWLAPAQAGSAISSKA